MAMGDSFPNLIPTPFQESIFPPITPLEIQAQGTQAGELIPWNWFFDSLKV
jgi:hypothetical protein